MGAEKTAGGAGGMPNSSAGGRDFDSAHWRCALRTLVGAGEPELRGVVVLFQDVAQPVGAVGAQPGRLVEVAQQGGPVAQVLDAAVDTVQIR